MTLSFHALAGRQWGRGRMAAEGPQTIVPWLDAAERQWGRGRMAAEGVHPQPALVLQGSVNGAAAGWPRKAVSDTTIFLLPVSVNGAAAGWPRKARLFWSTAPVTYWRQWGRGRMAAEG